MLFGIFFAAFNIFFVLYLTFLIIIWQKDFSFWFNQFGVLCASCIFKGIWFFSLENFSCIIFLQIFFWVFELVFSLFSIPITYSFGIFIVSQISYMFSVRKMLDLTYSLTTVSISSTVYSFPAILSSISCFLLVTFASVVPFYISKIFISLIAC